MRIAFLLPGIGLAGGIYIVLEHALGLANRHGHDVTIVTTDEHDIAHTYPSLADLQLMRIDEVAGQDFDLAVGTWWHTVYSLPRVVAPRYVHFLQNLEDRFYTPSEVAARTAASAVQALPLTFITTAGWLEAQMRLLRPDAAVYCVRSGVDKEVFRPQARNTEKFDGPLRITIEGPADVWFKGVPEALSAVQRMREARHLTVIAGDRAPSAEIRRLADEVRGRLTHQEVADVLRNTDVLLKLSRVEGMSGPPLEGFHCGATAVITPVTGYDEYGAHGVNCMIVGHDDVIGTARTLDLLARDRRFLNRLRQQAMATASQWPDWEQATAALDAALTEIAETAPVADAAYARRLMVDVYSAYLRQLAVADYLPQGTLGQVLWVWRHEGILGVARRVVHRLAMSFRRGRRALDSKTASQETNGWESPTDALINKGFHVSETIDDESKLIFLYEYMLKRGDTVIDAGAGHGTEVVSFSRLVGPSGRVIAVEAHPIAFRDLQDLYERHDLQNVELIHAALGTMTGESKISDLTVGMLNSTISTAANGLSVPARTLDEITQELELDHVDYLKMNIEGAEIAALEGFRQGLKRTKNVCIGCHDFLAERNEGYDEMRTRERVRELLEEAGFQVTSQAHSLPWISDYLYGKRL